MSDEIGVNTITLKSEIESIDSELQSIKTDIETMFAEFQTLDSMWDGEASEAFKIQFVQDKASLESFCDTVKSLINSMEFAKGAYDKCEAGISDTISGIRT